MFGALLLLGSLLHAGGSIAHYGFGTQELVWALSGSLAGSLTAIINLVRCERSSDFTISVIALISSVGWLAVALGFGAAIGALFDPRVLWHAICALVLAAFSLRAMRQDPGRKVAAGSRAA
ncbi:MAG: hypothetical protein E7774_09505 [Bradyrhizobium sp.]|nr:MAG: hypothetical protein E7774_09505 [Bradyrhizobium sp.]